MSKKEISKEKVSYFAFLNENNETELLYSENYVKQLQDRINKTIEYIENKQMNYEFGDFTKIAKILKGNDYEKENK